MDRGKIYEFHIEKSGLPNKGFHKTFYNTRISILSMFFLAVPLEMNRANDVCNLEK